MPHHLKSAVPAGQVRAARADVAERVTAILDDIRERGDEAVRQYSEKFDDWSPESFRLSQDDIARIVADVPGTVLDDIRFVQQQVRTFAQAQRDSMHDIEIETLPGVRLGHRHVPGLRRGRVRARRPLPADRVRPHDDRDGQGGRRLAGGCLHPADPGRDPGRDRRRHASRGADEIYLLGGVQAVAALAVGTETIGRVPMIAGPGNAYVAEAKRQLFGEVGIDLFAGPTEILVIADEHADPFVVAVDLLSQAEHGPDSPAVLVTTSEDLGREVERHIERLLPTMPTRDFAGPAWRDHGEIVVVDSLDEAFTTADSYASEHVEVLTENPRQALERMHDYGALFLGERTCVSYGDKVIGTNHVLPTRVRGPLHGRAVGRQSTSRR